MKRKKAPLDIPDIPESTGNTQQLVPQLRQARKDLGWSQEDAAEVIYGYGVKVAEKYGEDPRWDSLSGAAISQWERMFNPGISRKEKRLRTSFSLMNYAHWARCVGDGLFVRFLPRGSEGRYVWMDDSEAEIAEMISELPIADRLALVGMVRTLHKANKKT